MSLDDVTKVFPLTECNNNSSDSAGTVKYKLTGDSVKAQLFTKDCRFSVEEDAQAVLSTQPINDGDLTVSVGERAGLEAEAPGRSRQVVVMKVGRFRKKFLPPQERRTEINFPLFDKDPQLTHAAKDVFLDLPGQPRLAGASMGGRVRVRIHRERSILTG